MRRRHELERDGDVFIVPSSEAGGFDSITRSANELLSKINRIDFDAHRQVSLVGARQGPRQHDQRAADQEIPGAWGDVDVQDIDAKLDAGVAPALKRLPEIAAQLQGALDQANRLVASINPATATIRASTATSKGWCARSPTRRVDAGADRPADPPSRGPDQGPDQPGKE